MLFNLPIKSSEKFLLIPKEKPLNNKIKTIIGLCCHFWRPSLTAQTEKKAKEKILTPAL